jgi:hypothetical protein
MPSDSFAARIQQSLAPGEQYADFAYLFDTLTQLRRPFQREQNFSEEVTGWLLCVFVPAKPEKYRRAMQEFRLRFYKVANEPLLQADFSNRVRNAALTVSNPTSVVWTPSVYFQGDSDLGEWF